MEKIKNLLGGSLSCDVPEKGEGVVCAPPSVCQCDERHTEKRIYIIYYIQNRSFYIVYNISCLKRPETPQKPTCMPFSIRRRKEYLHFCLKRPKRQINILTESRKTKQNTDHTPPQHAHNVRRHGKTTSGNGKEAARKSTRKKHTQQTGQNVQNVIFLVRACVRVLSWETAAPPTRTTLKSYFLRRRSSCSRACVCIMWRCSGGCSNVFLCVWVLCMFFPPCAPWLTV